MDNAARILELLNFPLMHRCAELGLLFDRCNLKELQDIFPRLVESIFNAGGYGWGLRMMTKNNAPTEFDVLYNFFIPLGPMFQLIYRLLNDSMKYEVPLAKLPIKMQQMIESGRYSTFYTEIVNIDPFRRQIVSLYLNSFDYFMLHFAVHGMVPLHNNFPAAMAINTEKWKSPYFFLTADYLCCFMPSNPDQPVMPQNICKTVKSAPTSPTIQQIQPARTPKYIKISALHHIQSPTTGVSPPRGSHDSWKMNAWRTESVLYIFTDTWLRYDCEDQQLLPSSEFLRVVRILVKQLHAFGNSAETDHTSMSMLRQIAQPVMNARIYPFLKSIISRWPLDSSFSDVLELWLSFLQPWRYTYNRNLADLEAGVPAKYQNFVAENLIVYSQIFVKLIPRFERLDLSTLRNIHMWFRVLKVFNQPPLAVLLRRNEMEMRANNMTTLSNSTFEPFNRSNGGSRPGSSCSGANVSGGDWRVGDISTGHLDDSYASLFGDRVVQEMGSLLRKVHLTKLSMEKNLQAIEQQRRKIRGFWKMVRSWFQFDKHSVQEELIQEKRKVVDLLNVCTQMSAGIFEIDLADLALPEHNDYVEDSDVESFDNMMNLTMQSDLSDQSIFFSPTMMKNRSRLLTYKGDPALRPITSGENVFLVRILHQLSCKLNLMFSEEMDELWSRRTFVGRMARQILCPPQTVQNFDTSRDKKILRTENLEPRLCLRPLASYKSLTLIGLSLMFGYVFLGAPSYGLLLLLALTFVALFINSLTNDLSVG